MNFKIGVVDGKLMHARRFLLGLAALLAIAVPSLGIADSILPALPNAPARGAPNGVVEVDTRGSGVIDYRVFYDQAGKVSREELDSRHVGRMDTFYYYKDGILQRVEIDSKGNGKIDIWVYLLDGTYIQRYERDTTGSGKPDVVKVFGVK